MLVLREGGLSNTEEKVIINDERTEEASGGTGAAGSLPCPSCHPTRTYTSGVKMVNGRSVLIYRCNYCRKMFDETQVLTSSR